MHISDNNYQTNKVIVSQSANPNILYIIKNHSSLADKTNIHKYKIERKNIGEILSEFLAWRGLLLIPFAFLFMLLPFVESFLKVDLIKARYTCPELDTLEFSAATDIKRKFADCCNLQKEKVLNCAFDAIDNELDILQILRKQCAMKQRITEVETVEKAKDIFSCEFEHEDKAELLQLDKEGSSQTINNEREAEDYDFKEEETDQGISGKLSDVAKVFDETETPIEVMANAGKGYGSFWNIVVLAVLSTSLIVGLVLLGLFEVEESLKVAQCVPSDEEEFEMTLRPGTFSFRPVW